ncbi:MAG: glutamine amidotransferase [Candidatus Sericytochromatia bacterium]|nr:MAG: glutamine amidotransferase [Candidatus Sericytochromatia bacterium]
MSKKKVGVILSGCGFKDGTEIHEAVFTLLFLDKEGVEYICMAPDVEQTFVVNHLTGERTNEKRNVLVESARIARGNIKNIKDVNPEELDAVILPGGFGAALNLCSFGTEGKNMSVNPEIERFIKKSHSLGKPLGFICISPVIAAKVLGNEHVKLTIGNDKATAEVIESFGAKHENKNTDDISVDEKYKVVSTPAYMLGPGPKDVANGIEKLVKKVLSLIK